MRLRGYAIRAAAMLALAPFFLTPVHGGTTPPDNILYGFITTDRTLTAASPGPIYEVIGDVI